MQQVRILAITYFLPNKKIRYIFLQKKLFILNYFILEFPKYASEGFAPLIGCWVRSESKSDCYKNVNDVLIAQK